MAVKFWVTLLSALFIFAGAVSGYFTGFRHCMDACHAQFPEVNAETTNDEISERSKICEDEVREQVHSGACQEQTTPEPGEKLIRLLKIAAIRDSF